MLHREIFIKYWLLVAEKIKKFLIFFELAPPVKIKFDCQDNAKIVPWFYQSLANIGISLAALHFCLAILVDHSKTNV